MFLEANVSIVFLPTAARNWVFTTKALRKGRKTFIFKQKKLHDSSFPLSIVVCFFFEILYTSSKRKTTLILKMDKIQNQHRIIRNLSALRRFIGRHVSGHEHRPCGHAWWNLGHASMVFGRRSCGSMVMANQPTPSPQHTVPQKYTPED